MSKSFSWVWSIKTICRNYWMMYDAHNLKIMALVHSPSSTNTKTKYKILILTDAPSFTNTNSNTHLKYCYLQTHHPPTPSEANLRCHKLNDDSILCLIRCMLWYFWDTIPSNDYIHRTCKPCYSVHNLNLLSRPAPQHFGAPGITITNGDSPWLSWFNV